VKDPYKRGTKPVGDPNEITPESFFYKLMEQTGLTREELLKKLNELTLKLEELKKQK
jgi:hypothetical protein